MKVKNIVSSALLAAVIFGVVFYRNMHVVTFDGIRLELPYIVDKTSGPHDVTVTKIPPDNTLLIISKKDVNFDKYKSNVLRKSQSEIIFEEKILTESKVGPIELVMSRLTLSPQSIVVHGFIVNKGLNFTFYGDKTSVDILIASLKQIEPAK